jgi:proline iminopeptidase
LATAYNVLLQGDDLPARDAAAIEWCAWEDAVVALDAGRTAGSKWDDPAASMAFARLCAHYFSHHGFLPDGGLLRNADRLHGIRGALIHGRLDLTSPLVTAYRMSQAWPEAEFHPISGAGHSSGPGMGETIGDVLDRFAADWEVQP